ncbi:MAG: hypothetical protein ACQESR_28120 [Planctomycetota bacterium]
MSDTTSGSGGAFMGCPVGGKTKTAKSWRSEERPSSVLQGQAANIGGAWQRQVWLFSMVLLGTMFLRGAPAFGIEEQNPSDQSVKTAPAAVEFFAAMQRGMIDVRVVAHNYSSLAIKVRNATRKPLRVELPATFAAVPARRVQARQALRMRGMQASLSDGYVQQQANSQGLGGSLGGPWWNRAVARNDQGQNVKKDTPRDSQGLTLAAGRFAQARIPCFCLEYGNPDPNSGIRYVIRPLEELNEHAGVAKLLAEFGQQEMNQYAAQLAAWHMANDVPWKALTKFRFPRTGDRPGHRVTQAELVAARKLVRAAKQSSLSRSR